MHISAIPVSDNDRSSFIVYLGVRQACSSMPESAGSRVHSDREYLSGRTRERENRLRTELGDAVGRRRTIVKEKHLVRRAAARKFVLLSFRWWRWVRRRLYPCLQGMDYLSRVPMYLVAVYIFPTRRAMKILLALGRLPRRVRLRFVSAECLPGVGAEVVRTCFAATRPAGYSSIPVT